MQYILTEEEYKKLHARTVPNPKEIDSTVKMHALIERAGYRTRLIGFANVNVAWGKCGEGFPHTAHGFTNINEGIRYIYSMIPKKELEC